MYYIKIFWNVKTFSGWKASSRSVLLVFKNVALTYSFLTKFSTLSSYWIPFEKPSWYNINLPWSVLLWNLISFHKSLKIYVSTWNMLWRFWFLDHSCFKTKTTSDHRTTGVERRTFWLPVQIVYRTDIEDSWKQRTKTSFMCTILVHKDLKIKIYYLYSA